MKRRNFLMLAAAAAGSKVVGAQAAPCPPPTLGIDGFIGATSSCSTGGTPLWLRDKGLLTWYSLPGTAMIDAMTYPAPPGVEGKQGICSYSGGTIKKSGSEVFINGGGHNAYAGNEVLSFKLSNDAPAWQVRRPPTSVVSANTPRMPDGRPQSRHTGWDIVYSNTRDKMMLLSGNATYNIANAINTVEAFNPATGDWDHLAGIDYPNFPGTNTNNAHPVVEDGAGNLWWIGASGFDVWKFQTNNTWSRLADLSSPVPIYPAGGAYDPVRNRVVAFSEDGSKWWNAATNAQTSFTFGLNRSGTAVWCEDRNTFLYFPWSGTTVYEVDPVSYSTSVLSIGGNTPPAPRSEGYNWILGRFFYAPELKICGYIRDTTTDMFFFRTG